MSQSRWFTLLGTLVVLIAIVLIVGTCAVTSHADPRSHTSITLVWTAVGDDSLLGRASQYDVRYNTAPLTAANFLSAARFTPVMLPSPPGVRDSVVVTGLQPQTTYWFALRVADEVPNWSGMSNVVSATTLAPPDTTRPACPCDVVVR